MNVERDMMISALKVHVIPVLRNLGFKGSFPHFRRLTEERINLMTFQFDKWGGGFVIEIANCDPKGFTTSWGKFLEPGKVTAHDIISYDRRRIQSNMAAWPNSSTDDWFRYDGEKRLLCPGVYEAVCEDVLSKLHFAETYWKGGSIEAALKSEAKNGAKTGNGLGPGLPLFRRIKGLLSKGRQ